MIVKGIRTAPTRPYDLLLKLEPGARLFNSHTKAFEKKDVAFAGGTVARVERDIPQNQANEVVWIQPDEIVTPPIADLHFHAAKKMTFWGIDPDIHGLYKGTPVITDAGTTGRINFKAFYENVIEPAQARIYAFLNIASQGLVDPHRENFDLTYHDAEATAEVARQYPGVIVGVKVRLGWLQCKKDTWRKSLKLAIQAAEYAGLPVMVHISDGPPLDKIIEMLRLGDIVTHCCHGWSQDKACTILTKDNKLRPCVKEAIRKGIRFDIGHGSGSFSKEVAEIALDQGFMPWSISSDLHTASVGGPAFSQIKTINKMLSLGVMLEDALVMSTKNPTEAIGLPKNNGRLMVGSPADCTVLLYKEADTDRYDFVDCKIRGRRQENWTSNMLLRKSLVVRNGVVI